MKMDVTEDAFLGGRLRLLQPAKGFRAGTDSVLLAAALPQIAQGQAIEFGCGVGGALLPAACRLSELAFTGLEVDASMASLARENLKLNAMSERADIVTGSAATLPQAWQNRFDLAFSNPPYFSEGAIVEPGEGKSGAYIEQVPLKAWINAMLFSLRPKGAFVMIHRAAELARILAVLERQTGDITVLPVRSFPGSEAKRVLIKARKGLRSGPMRLLAGLDLYEEKGGARTAIAEAITRDGEALAWS